MGSRSNAIEEITRFWLQSKHGCLVAEAIPVPVPYALSDIDIVAVTSDTKRKIELPKEAGGAEIGPRLIVETKDEHDWDAAGGEFAGLLRADLDKMGDGPYIPRGTKGVKFTMLREEHFAEAKRYFDSDDFDRLFVVHAMARELIGENAARLKEHRIYLVTIRELVADLYSWYRDPNLRKAGLRHTLVGDLWHLLVGFCKCEPRATAD